MTVEAGGKIYKSATEMFEAWRKEELLWPWYKKAYYAWIRGPLWPPKIWYWIRCHTYNRYHILDMRTKEYRYGWGDHCELVLYASFKLLCLFIEQENPPKNLDEPEYKQSDHWETCDKHWDAAYKEMWVLYNWWTKERTENPEDDYRGTKDQEMLKRLVEIRQYLWM